ncbi:MAG: hemin uptake protein HemP [Azonexaceae bacterium]|nr:hemin uptake protein HemP [Azonexaceae bacterium]
MSHPPKPAAPEKAPDKTELRRRIHSEHLLCGESTIEIEHAGQCYLLRVTRENKLILTK